MDKPKKYLLIAVGLLLLSVNSSAQAGTHFGIIADFLNSKNDPAYFDLVSGGPSTNVRYTVYQANGNRVQTVAMNNQFATSPDLMNLGGSPVVLPALVSAETVDQNGVPDGVSTAAILRQKKLILATRQVTRGALGATFAFPLGDLGNGVHLLVGNPNGLLINVDYSVNGVAQPQTAVEAGQVKDILLTTAPAIIIVNTTANVVMGLAIVGKGQDFSMTLIPPA